MKTDQMMYALIGGGVVALAWAASQLAGSIPFESVIGYGVVFGVAAMTAMDYRISARKRSR